jgi:hypothetical protein
MEACPEATVAHPGALQAQSGAVEAHHTVLIESHIMLRKLSLSTRARTQKSCTVSPLLCAFPNPV